MMTRISTGNSKVSTYMGWDLEDSVKAYMYTPSIDQWDHGKVYKRMKIRNQVPFGSVQHDKTSRIGSEEMGDEDLTKEVQKRRLIQNISANCNLKRAWVLVVTAMCACGYGAIVLSRFSVKLPQLPPPSSF
jgi:hypothetical protein